MTNYNVGRNKPYILPGSIITYFVLCSQLTAIISLKIGKRYVFLTVSVFILREVGL